MLQRLVVSVVLVAACTPSAPSGDDDDVVDAPANIDASSREMTTSCEAERFEITYADGHKTAQVFYWGRLDQPFEWAAVSWRICNPIVEGPAAGPACPSGATCTGMPPNYYPYCRSGRGIEQVDSGTAAGRVWCGAVNEATTAAGVTTKSGYRYQFATIRVD